MTDDGPGSYVETHFEVGFSLIEDTPFEFDLEALWSSETLGEASPNPGTQIVASLTKSVPGLPTTFDHDLPLIEVANSEIVIDGPTSFHHEGVLSSGSYQLVVSMRADSEIFVDSSYDFTFTANGAGGGVPGIAGLGTLVLSAAILISVFRQRRKT